MSDENGTRGRLMEIRSSEVQEILGYIPHWIIRWGITLFFAVVFVLVLGSWFFKYPDVIASSIEVTTRNPPASVISRTNGKIQHLFVKDKQRVEKGEFMAVIENASRFRHVLELKKQLGGLKTAMTQFRPADFTHSPFDRDYSLGGLQSDYELFLKSFSDYRYFLKLNYHQQKIDSLKEQIKTHNVYYQQISRQNEILEEEFKLQQKQYERAKKLKADGIISQHDLENSKSTFLQKKHTLEGAKTRLANEKMQIAKFEESVLDLKLSREQQKKQLQILLKQSYDNLIGQISLWEQNYVLKSPIRGVVTFTSYWSVNQNVKAGDAVITVVPDSSGGSNEIIGKLTLPIEGSGKVKPGQRVNIKFSNYPHSQYGMVEGVVKSKSLVPTENAYTVEVALSNGLTTNYGKSLEFNQKMKGAAEIITEDIRLLERIFKPIKAIITAHVKD